jgi:predicted HicB family RNase H-like nuclease
MKASRRKPNVSIRIDPEILHQAKIASATNKKTLGDWLEEAINEKIKRQV